jgi:hypothetical protein
MEDLRFSRQTVKMAFLNNNMDLALVKNEPSKCILSDLMLQVQIPYGMKHFKEIGCYFLFNVHAGSEILTMKHICEMESRANSLHDEIKKQLKASVIIMPFYSTQ